MTALECPEVRGVRVLVVDDDPDNCDLIATILLRNGAVVATAGSAAEASKEFQRERPDLLISDIGLPDGDGYSLLRSLRELPRSRDGDFPAIALTGYGNTLQTREQVSREEGFQAHLTKPISLSDLLVTVGRLLSGRTST